MGRSPCCDDSRVKKGPWTPEEDKKLMDYIQNHGHGSWRALPKLAGLNRCGKSCRLRWANYLRPDIKRGKFSEDEDRLIIHLHSVLGNKWSAMATHLPGRTDNEIKNYWNTHLKKKLLQMGIDPVTHRQRTDLNLLAILPNFLAANLGNFSGSWDNAFRLHQDVTQLAKFQLLQSLIHVLNSNSPSNMDSMNLMGTSSLGNYQFSDLNRQFEGLLGGSLGFSQDRIPTPSSFLNLGVERMPNCVQAYTNSSRQENDAQSNGFCSNSYINVPISNSTPLVSTSLEDVPTDQQRDAINTNDVSTNTSSSTPFESWEGLNLDDPHSDFCWKDILDHTSWSIAS